MVAHTLEQPTRSVLIGTGRPSLPIWPCSRWGLPCRGCHHPRGELLPRRFTLACAPVYWAIGGLFSVALSVEAIASPRRYLAACPVEPGLSSSACTLATARPTASIRKIMHPTGDEEMTRSSYTVRRSSSPAWSIDPFPHASPTLSGGGSCLMEESPATSFRQLPHCSPPKNDCASMRPGRVATGRCIEKQSTISFEI